MFDDIVNAIWGDNTEALESCSNNMGFSVGNADDKLIVIMTAISVGGILTELDISPDDMQLLRDAYKNKVTTGCAEGSIPGVSSETMLEYF